MKKKVVDEQSEKFFVEVLSLLIKEQVPFLIGGTYAFREFTGIQRSTKDLDIFCKGGDYQKLLHLCKEAGFKTEITDARWLAKVLNGKDNIDIIFASASGLIPVDATWFDFAPKFHLLGMDLPVVPPVELLWSKSYVADRDKYEGPDVAHLILKQGKKMDWKRLLMRMEPHWELLLSHLILFRFIYPSEREIVPKWLIEELLSRVDQQFNLPTPKDKVCRGPILSRYHYRPDILDWGFHDIT